MIVFFARGRRSTFSSFSSHAPRHCALVWLGGGRESPGPSRSRSAVGEGVRSASMYVPWDPLQLQQGTFRAPFPCSLCATGVLGVRGTCGGGGGPFRVSATVGVGNAGARFRLSISGRSYVCAPDTLGVSLSRYVDVVSCRRRCVRASRRPSARLFVGFRDTRRNNSRGGHSSAVGIHPFVASGPGTAVTSTILLKPGTRRRNDHVSTALFSISGRASAHLSVASCFAPLCLARALPAFLSRHSRLEPYPPKACTPGTTVAFRPLSAVHTWARWSVRLR